MRMRSLAEKLGRRGGIKRAQKLSARRRKEIASVGGKARAEAHAIAKRIEENFRTLETIRELASS